MNKYEVIGVMSGTSMDGLDIVYVQFQFDGRWAFKILKNRAQRVKEVLKNIFCAKVSGF